MGVNFDVAHDEFQDRLFLFRGQVVEVRRKSLREVVEALDDLKSLTASLMLVQQG